LVGGFVAAEQTPSCTITVRPGQSIQAAIDSAPSGAVICLAAGEFREHIEIGKALTLRGEGSDKTTIAWVPGKAELVRVSYASGPVALDGVALDADAWQVSFDQPIAVNGIEIGARAEVMVSSCEIKAKGTGIRIGASAPVTVAHCLIRGGSYGINVEADEVVTIADCAISDGSWGIGISSCSSSVVSIEDCNISKNGTGVGLIGMPATMPSTIVPMCTDSHFSITRSRLAENGIGISSFDGFADVRSSHLAANGTGIALSGKAVAYIGECDLLGNACGISLSGRSIAVIRESSVVGCGGQLGLKLDDEAHAGVLSCVLSGSDAGIYLRDGAGARLENCEIYGNRYGVFAAGLSEAGIEVVGCTIRDNRFGVAATGSSAVTLESNTITGNSEYGVVAAGPDCLSALGMFEGRLTGKMNAVLGPGAQRDAVCPVSLGFLTTEQGGGLDLRK
jgi:parallel beta-helix repeat protein